MSDEIKTALYAIGRTYPSLAGLLAKPFRDGSGNVASHWAGLLAELDRDHVLDVCEEFASARREMPADNDRLIYAIREQVNLRTAMNEMTWEKHVERMRYQLVKSGELAARDWPAETIAAKWRASQRQNERRR